MTDHWPTREIFYYQAPYDPKEDYPAHYYLPVSAISETWAFPAVSNRDYFWQAFRVADGFLQRMILTLREPPPTFRLETDDWSIRLFEALLRIRPINWAIDDFELELHIGRSRETDKFYMRYGAGTSIAPAELQERAAALGFGFEEPAMWDPTFDYGHFWWVTYFDEVTQNQFQFAYDRLVVITDWLSTLANRAYRSARLEVSRRMKQVLETGWMPPRPVDSLANVPQPKAEQRR